MKTVKPRFPLNHNLTLNLNPFAWEKEIRSKIMIKIKRGERHV
jgi:hypothetical protein